MRETSLAAYRSIEEKIGTKQREVLVALAMSKRPVCNQELAEYLHQPINTITPRIHELVTMNKVKQAFKAVYPVTNRRVIYWTIEKYGSVELDEEF